MTMKDYFWKDPLFWLLPLNFAGSFVLVLVIAVTARPGSPDN